MIVSALYLLPKPKLILGVTKLKLSLINPGNAILNEVMQGPTPANRPLL